MKNILIIHTGGTFGMSPTQPGNKLEPGNIESDIKTYLPELGKIASIDVKIAFNTDSSNIGPSHWKKIYGMIKDEKDKYDGFVIIHGTDTVVYTASALSYLLAGFEKPVLLTGAQRPLSSVRSDARANLINTIELATYDIKEVGIYFASKLFRGNRTKKISIESYHGFDSPNYPALATVGLNIELHPEFFLKQRSGSQLEPKFDKNIAAIQAFPGLDPGTFSFLLERNLRAILLSGYGAGNLPNDNPDWIPFIKEATNNATLVCIYSQALHGNIDLDLYASGRAAKKAGALSLRDMTLEAALVKLMLLSGNGYDKNALRKRMIEPLAGEIR